MTTIAYANGELAADTMSTSRSNPYGYSTKIGKGPNGEYLYAAAGDTALAQRFRAWCADGMKGQCPAMSQSGREAEGYVFYPDHTVASYERDLPVSRLAVHRCAFGCIWAAGSGSEIALGAMFAGASPGTAVGIAILLDSHSGGRIDEVTFASVPF